MATIGDYFDAIVSEETPHIDDMCSARGRARLFGRVLARLPIGLRPGAVLAGDFGAEYADKAQRQQTAPRASETPEPPSQTAAPVDPVAEMGERFKVSGNVTLSHVCVDYARVIEEGVAGIVADIRGRLPDADESQRDVYEGMILSLEALGAWAQRYAELADRRAAQTCDPDAARELRQLAEVCRKVPLRPADTFQEAAQSFWFAHAGVALSEGIVASISPGRMDQFLYPAFRRDRRRGVGLDALERVVDDLWAKIRRFGAWDNNVNVGGLDADGDDAFNELSALILRVAARHRSNVPLLSVRVHPDLSDEAFARMTDPALLSMGQPTFYGEHACLRALHKRGVAPADLHRWAASSCMALTVQGREYSGMWDIVMNGLLPLELALNEGRPFGGELPIELDTPPRADYASVEPLVDQWARYTRELVGWCVARSGRASESFGRYCPNPLISALMGCAETGRDRAAFGAPYHCVNANVFGLVNASDALVAIDRLVFGQKRYALRELVDMARNDYRGREDVLTRVRACPKFGNDDDEADAMAARLAAIYAEAVRSHSHDNVHYLPSFHTLYGHIDAGRRYAASLDGRRAGEPLAKNVGTGLGRSRAGVTALMLSASRIDQPEFSGGQALDIALAPGAFQTPEGRRRLRALLQTYFDRGGLQVQLNIVSADALREAMADPRRHEDLMVRVAGFSARFVHLEPETQADLLARVEEAASA